MTTIATQTIKARYDAAIKDAKAAGVNIRQNVRSCCRSCAGYEMANKYEAAGNPEKIERTVWTFGGQGSRISWEWDGTPYYPQDNGWTRRTGKEAVVQYWNFENVEYAQKVYEAFKSHGFEIDWDGSEFKCVVVTLKGGE